MEEKRQKANVLIVVYKIYVPVSIFCDKRIFGRIVRPETLKVQSLWTYHVVLGLVPDPPFCSLKGETTLAALLFFIDILKFLETHSMRNLVYHETTS